MTEPYPYQPIIRLPKSKSGGSPTRSNRRSTFQPVPAENGQCIVSETLYFDGLENTVSEEDIRSLLHRCQPTEVVIHQGQGSGYLVFSDPKTADRVYSLYNGFTFPDGTSKLQFRIYQDDGSYEPEPKGPILQVKHLPLKIDNNALYEMFRPFGPLSLCKPIVEGKGFRGTAFVQYFYQEDSDMAQSNLDGKTIDGNVINVVSFMPSKTRNASVADQGNKDTPASNTAMPTSTVKQEGGGYVDYMNLYIKNLDPAIGNNELFNLFRKFGRIVSARVMSNPATGQSKGYGFVSYDKQEEAAAALQEMNGKMVMSKALMVAYHEPKKPRQEKQQQQSQQQNQPPLGSSSPLVNPLQNYMGPIGTPVRTSPHFQDYTPNASAATAAAAGPATGIGAPAYLSHDTRHSYDMAMPPPPINAVNGLGIDNVDQIALSMKTIGQKRPSPPNPLHRKFSAAESSYSQHPLRLSPPFSASPMSGVSSTGPSLASLASGLNVQPRPKFPQHQEYNTRENGRPSLRRKGSLESISSVMTESSASIQRQRLMEAIMRCGDYGNNVNDIVDMLLTLKRKERSLCLFNQDFLREKIHLALEALETFNDGTEEDEAAAAAAYEQNVPNQSPNANSSLHHGSISPIPRSNGFVQTQPRASKAIPIVPPPATSSNTSPSKANGEGSNKNNANSNGNDSQSIEESVQEIEKLLASLEGKPIHEKKQQLGDRLFPLVKATGTKQAPKVTIRLLDTIDLHELARLMYDKVQLKERVDIAFAALK